MRLVSFGPRGAEQPGMLTDAGSIVPLRPVLATHGLGEASMPEILPLLPALRPLLAEAREHARGALASADTRIGAPVPRPGMVYAAGGNYRSHLAEIEGKRHAGPFRPVLFAKAPSSVSGPYDPVVRPPETSELDYECELAVVIGIGGRRIPASEAMSHVAGYMIANDVTARDVFLGESGKNPLLMQSLCGKGFDTFCPTGPWLLTSEEVPDYRNLQMRLWVNDELRQDASPAQMIFDLPTLVSAVSSCFTLRPGDIILTGTPAGVGMGFTPPRFLTAGDVLRLEITGLGTMTTSVVEE
ncbi:fumarylacetoacetate hydrolase family protein [Streptomyces sp. NPDC085932]|uniref:fumarylacetoacetate hydrolase family protein n=1 Tax=Streptomyces sp. NPDC085932 TaxID=3365741 RepID=UPI0037D43A6D